MTPNFFLRPRTYLAGVAVSLAAALLVLLVMAVLGEYTKTRGRLLLTALSLAGFCALAFPSAALASRGRHPRLAAVGVSAAALGFVLVAAGLWATPDSDAFWKAASIASIAAASVAYSSWVLSFRPQRLASQIARYAALGVAALVLFLTTLAIIVEIRQSAFWWAVVLLIIAQVACAIAAAAPARWTTDPADRDARPSDKSQPPQPPML